MTDQKRVWTRKPDVHSDRKPYELLREQWETPAKTEGTWEVFHCPKENFGHGYWGVRLLNSPVLGDRHASILFLQTRAIAESIIDFIDKITPEPAVNNTAIVETKWEFVDKELDHKDDKPLYDVIKKALYEFPNAEKLTVMPKEGRFANQPINIRRVYNTPVPKDN